MRVALFYAVLAVGACFVPLVQLVGYESAAMFGVVGGLLALLWPVRVSHTPARAWLERVGFHTVLLGLPLLALSLNSLRVQNCDPWLGYQFWGLITWVSVAVGTAFRVAVDSTGWSASRRMLASLFLGFLSVAVFGWQLAMEPPINGYQLFLGYFSGSIYDEALSIPGALVYYRLWTCLLAAAVVAVADAVYRWRSFFHVWTASALAILLSMAAVVGWVARREFDVDLDRSTIAERLGGKVETEHFEIYFPATREWLDQAHWLAEDHEFRYAQMKAYFGTDPVALRGRKVRSFVYGDREQKGALMGGRRTLVAKLWLGEMHILWRDFGDHLLAHELSHIFTEPFGAGPLRLSSRWGVGVNMGLVEGIATAADWPAGDLDVHMAAAALRRLDAAPDIRRLLGAAGFWTQSSSRAYTLMGSFIAFLVDRDGIETFKLAYPNGDFEGAYGRPVDALVADWEVFLDAIALSEADMARARFQYDRPSIFEKVCARTVAELRRQAEEQGRLGEAEAGKASWEAILAFDPNNVRYRLEYAGFLARIGSLDEALVQARQVLAGEVSEGERALGLELVGDVLWQKKDLAGAREHYAACLGLGVSSEQRRTLEAKSGALTRDAVLTEIAYTYLIDSEDRLGAYWPAMWLAHAPEDALGHYLLARRMLGATRWADARDHLLKAVEGLDGTLLNEARFQLLSARYFLGEFDEAALVAEALKSSETPYRTHAEEWSDRVAWARRNRIEAQGR